MFFFLKIFYAAGIFLLKPLLKNCPIYSIIFIYVLIGGEILRILAVGDVCGESGCSRLLSALPKFKRENNIDFTVVNGENSAASNGISKDSAKTIIAAGADVITGGNHTLHRKDFRPLLDSNEFFLRPHNMPDAQYGSGYCITDMGYTKIAVIRPSFPPAPEHGGHSSAFFPGGPHRTSGAGHRSRPQCERAPREVGKP